MAPRKAKTIEPEPVGIEGEQARVEETRLVERGEPSATTNKLDLILTQLAGVSHTITHMDNRLNALEQRKDPPQSHTSSYYRRNAPIGTVSESFLGDARRASLGGLGVVPPRATPDSPHAPIRPHNTRRIFHPQPTNETHGEPTHVGERARREGERLTPEEIRRAFQEIRQNHERQHQHEPYQHPGNHLRRHDNRSNHSMTLGDYEEDLDREIEEINGQRRGQHPAVEGKVTPQASFSVMVGNGEKMTCSAVCKNVCLEMQKAPFDMDLYLLPIGGVDVVLGIQWMKPLKKTLYDWENMTFSFPKEGGGEIILEAINPSVDPKSALKALIGNQPAYWLVGADAGALQNPSEVKSSTTKVESNKAPHQASVEKLREVKEFVHIEDPSTPCLEEEDPNLPCSDDEDLGAPSLGVEDPIYTGSVEEGLVTLDLGIGGLGLKRSDPVMDQG
ncbi:hypothetical protein EJ110_NYTH12933 [Nymphaea thermarum]|nr:hypothetical protein EJ110_NYTH12933 [Nymphaea thermarum]